MIVTNRKVIKKKPRRGEIIVTKRKVIKIRTPKG